MIKRWNGDVNPRRRVLMEKLYPCRPAAPPKHKKDDYGDAFTYKHATPPGFYINQSGYATQRIPKTEAMTKKLFVLTVGLISIVLAGCNIAEKQTPRDSA